MALRFIPRPRLECILPEFSDQLAIWEKTRGTDHPNAGSSLAGLASLALEQGQAQRALPLLERAVAIDDAHPGVQEDELGHRFELAKALILTHGDRARALAQARAAAEGYREAGEGKTEDLAEVEAWLAEHGDEP